MAIKRQFASRSFNTVCAELRRETVTHSKEYLRCNQKWSLIIRTLTFFLSNGTADHQKDWYRFVYLLTCGSNVYVCR